MATTHYNFTELVGTNDIDIVTDVNTPLEEIDTALYRVNAVMDKSVDSTPTSASTNLVTSGGVYSAIQAIIDTIYPIGAIYWSTESTSPETLFGGSWTQIQDRFILAAGTTYTAGDTGGEATHTLTTSEIPNHKHSTIYLQTESSSQNVNIAGGGSGSGYQLTYTSSSTVSTSAPLITGREGGGNAHNNMPPYFVAYCWKRTA